MFTGIIECLGEITDIEREGQNIHFTVKSPISHELKVDQSVSHDGTCLTVTETGDGWHKVTAIDETLSKTNLGKWGAGWLPNLERSMLANGRFDGHIVQGHVDQTATCQTVSEHGGSWQFGFRYDAASGHFTVGKGSVCVNGVSLTVVDSDDGFFSVAIIPYTYGHTNFKLLRPGSTVNIEFDIIGKYLQKIAERKG